MYSGKRKKREISFKDTDNAILHVTNENIPESNACNNLNANSFQPLKNEISYGKLGIWRLLEALKRQDNFVDWLERELIAIIKEFTC